MIPTRIYVYNLDFANLNFICTDETQVVENGEDIAQSAYH